MTEGTPAETDLLTAALNANGASLEDQLLGGLLHAAQNPDHHVVELIERVGEEWFRSSTNRLVYAALRDLLRAGGLADLASIFEHLMSRKQHWDAGGATHLCELWESACPVEVVPAFIRMLIEEE